MEVRTRSLRRARSPAIDAPVPSRRKARARYRRTTTVEHPHRGPLRNVSANTPKHDALGKSFAAKVLGGFALLILLALYTSLSPGSERDITEDVTSSPRHFALAKPSVISEALEVMCPLGLSYLSRQGPVVGLADICVDVPLPYILQEIRPTDTPHGYNRTRINENFSFAKQVLAKLATDAQQVAEAVKELPSHGELDQHAGIYNSSRSLSLALYKTEHSIEKLLSNHCSTIQAINDHVNSFVESAEPNYEALQDCGQMSCLSSGFWLNWIPGFKTPMSRMIHDIREFASANRDVELKGLMQQTQSFDSTVKDLGVNFRKFIKNCNSWSEHCAKIRKIPGRSKKDRKEDFMTQDSPCCILNVRERGRIYTKTYDSLLMLSTRSQMLFAMTIKT